MIVAAHQPHFLPWLGYLDKIRAADLFVLVDHVQFERQNFQNRTRIKTRQGGAWLTVPVHRGSQRDRIVDKRIDNKRDGRIAWGQRLFRTLCHAYGKAPYFEEHASALEALLTARWERLVDLNHALLHYLLECFEIRTPLVYSSGLHGVAGARSAMIVSICDAVGADVYLSGSGGSRTYLELERFGREGVEVRWQAFEHPTYEQRRPPADFLARLSAVDLLFNCGPRSATILRGAAGPDVRAQPGVGSERVRPTVPVRAAATGATAREEVMEE